MIPGYEHHVFISYPRQGDVLDWVRNHLHPVLKRRLDEELPEEAQIFLDEQIETGSAWPDALARALHRSCCMVAVFCPGYFRSRWCMAEWQTMRKREELLGYRCEANPAGLVYPVVFSDGKCFPEEAKAIQGRTDLRPYAFPFPQFRDSKKYLKFYEVMTEVTGELAQWFDARIPPWDDSWPALRPPPEPPPPPRFPRL
jgi:hypothetical protein